MNQRHHCRCDRTAASRRGRADWSLRLAAPLLSLGLAACGTYEQAQPGVYVDLGQRSGAEWVCESGAPTAMLITRTSCRKVETVAETERQAREFMENRRVHQPRDLEPGPIGGR